MYAFTTLACLSGFIFRATAVVSPRDEWQPSKSFLRCLYMTNDCDWAGEGLQLCGEPGKCSMYSIPS